MSPVHFTAFDQSIAHGFGTQQTIGTLLFFDGVSAALFRDIITQSLSGLSDKAWVPMAGASELWAGVKPSTKSAAPWHEIITHLSATHLNVWQPRYNHVCKKGKKGKKGKKDKKGKKGKKDKRGKKDKIQGAMAINSLNVSQARGEIVGFLMIANLTTANEIVYSDVVNTAR
ncbi:hypothetical protein K432DRAFT_421400 [Lepidopterella palustris CBS 459.81]|uniref:Uncharacterized protein n=1 Tax=Lepidopterella palustris CBS 459.81 TaxID=1314670 RepID=A0A8E2EL10_9PEZI|nr:hypothetical protein K432DRAFT_421400 [Lepidopterella palustris CBS 459.81]